MRVAILSPFSEGPSRGNITTVERIRKHVSSLGVDVQVFPLDLPDNVSIMQGIAAFSPDIIHAFHACHCGPAAQVISESFRLPYIVTATGSDIYDASYQDRADTLAALSGAAAISCFDQQAQGVLKSRLPSHANVVVIPQGVELLTAGTAADKGKTDFVILMPAALRPAKGIDLAIAALKKVVIELPELKLWVAGGALDKTYAEEVSRYAECLPWISLIGNRPHSDMGSIYQAADLVLNYSRFEGGMANALLEAMSLGKCVVAVDIPGNRSLVLNEVNGLLFSSSDDLASIIIRLFHQPELRHSIGNRARQMVLELYQPEHEAQLYIELYTTTISQATL